jgi:TetR/AcrR family transcriptional regulator, ethionamide resistance regulator
MQRPESCIFVGPAIKKELFELAAKRNPRKVGNNEKRKPVSRVRKRVARRRDDLILDALERLLAKKSMAELDVEPIAVEAGITRTRFYHYFQSKHDALAALLRRLRGVLGEAYKHPDSWFVGRLPHVRPRDSMRKTIDIVAKSWSPHRFVLRETSDLWAAPLTVRDAWLQAIDFAADQVAASIERERKLGVAPPGYDARLIAEGLIWQSERNFFRVYAEIPGAMGEEEAKAVGLELWMRTIFLDDDPDPQAKR